MGEINKISQDLKPDKIAIDEQASHEHQNAEINRLRKLVEFLENKNTMMHQVLEGKIDKATFEMMETIKKYLK